MLDGGRDGDRDGNRGGDRDGERSELVRKRLKLRHIVFSRRRLERLGLLPIVILLDRLERLSVPGRFID